MADIGGLRDYLREYDSPDIELKGFLVAAGQFVANAGIPWAPAGSALLYDLLIYMLAAHWWDNRGVSIVGTSAADIPISAMALVAQLRAFGGDAS